MQPTHLATEAPLTKLAISHHLVTVSPTTPLVEALPLLNQTQTSCLFVVKDDRLLGTFSHRDVLQLISFGADLAESNMAEVMTPPAVALSESDFQDKFRALSLFWRRQVRYLPVLDAQGCLVGVVTPMSICQALQPINLLQARRVAEVMSTNVIHVPKTTSLITLVQLMVKHQVSCIVITEPGSELESKDLLLPIGTITEQDVVQLLSQKLDWQHAQAQEVMNWLTFSLSSYNSLWVAHQEMQRQNVQQLVVCGKHKELLGMITLGSMLRSLDPTETYGVIHTLQQSVRRLEAEKVELLRNRNAELEKQVQERTAQLEQQAERDRLLATTSLHIRQSLNLEEISNTTASQVRQFLQTDRVLIYRFDPTDWSSTVVIESTDSRWSSQLGKVVHNLCVGESCIQLYQEGRVQAIENVHTSALSQHYIDSLVETQVTAELVVPILQGEKLWGLLVAQHCEQPRQWQQTEIELVNRLSTQVGIAIQQSELYQQLQTELAERKQAEVALQKANEELEGKVEERTISWRLANEQLMAEIVERNRAEKALRESEEKFRNLVEQTSDWVWEVDENAAYTYVNPKVQEILGYEPAEILGKVTTDFMTTDEAKRFSTVTGYYLVNQEPFTQLEKTLLHKDGHPIIFESSGSPMWDQQGKLQGYRGITRDITERKRVEHEIRKALTKEKELNELKSRFVSMASHEFRTPLTTIMASAEALEHYSHKWSEEKKLCYLQRVQTTVKHMTRLLNDVLIIGKAEAGKLEFNPVPLDLKEFCQELVEELQLTTGANHTLNFVSQGSYADACMDEKLLRHILSNLLSNAIKYSPEGGNVYFSLSCHQGIATFQIQDEGIGIPPEDQQRLFESFHRAKNVGNIPGTGLGLAIVKRSVMAHNGKISVSSEMKKGTTFTVILPLN